MQWLEGLQQSIDYIEENILEKLDYEYLARYTNMSVFYYQRMFSVLVGISVGEYIRNRRLTLAGLELTTSNSKIIDIAFKYGYETAESFTKAFVRFHGITPSIARKGNLNLKSFSRITLKISLDGGNILDYKIVDKGEFSVIALKKQFSKDEDIFRKQIPKFWQELFRSSSYRELISYVKENTVTKGGVLGIDEMAVSQNKKLFNYYAAVETDEKPKNNEFTSFTIPSHKWAIFKCTGAMPNSIQNLWVKIYSEFFQCSSYEPVADFNFELYFGGDSSKDNYVSEIWVPIKNRGSL